MYSYIMYFRVTLVIFFFLYDVHIQNLNISQLLKVKDCWLTSWVSFPGILPEFSFIGFDWIDGNHVILLELGQLVLKSCL